MAPNPIRQFDFPATIVHGGGSRRCLPDLVRFLGGTRVLLVTDAGIVELGVAEEITNLLEASGVAVRVFDDVNPDPTDTNVLAGLDALQAHGANLVVALGGGSPIDAAKVIAVLPNNPALLQHFMGLHKIEKPGLPLIAIPTTAGTGSEATKVAVITDSVRHVKMMMLSVPLLPRAAIVDFELTLSMPKPLTAAVGIDTFTHGLEAFVSKKANAVTDPLALACIRNVVQFLRRACSQPDDREAREGMMLAACFGGMAFSNSSVALVHGMSRPIGAVFGLPHGLSNAVLLPSVTRFSVEGNPARYAIVAREIGCAQKSDADAKACEQLVQWIEQLNLDLEVPRLAACRGVTKEALAAHASQMASDALASGSPANNPRIPSEEQIVSLYFDAL